LDSLSDLVPADWNDDTLHWRFAMEGVLMQLGASTNILERGG